MGIALSGCGGKKVAPTAPPPSPPAPAFEAFGIPRIEFNQAAVRLNLPVYWVSDADNDQIIDPAEVAALRFYPTLETWVEGNEFTPAFVAVFAKIRDSLQAYPAQGISPEEAARRALVEKDLNQGRPTLVYSDLRGLSAAEKAFALHMQKVGELMDAAHLRQTGAAALVSQVPADHPASASLFRRHFGPRCMAPATENDPRCSAIPGAPKPLVDVYPADLQATEGFCETLAKHKQAEALLAPFYTVRGQGNALVPEPMSSAYKEQLEPAATELEAAASKLDDRESALRDYLVAAAAAMRNNDWFAADEAWVKTSARNSKWYVRVGPDETYWEPCSRKAGFHLTFARINADSLAWQEKLTPVQQKLEDTLAALIGKPYKARKVAFQLPDFIDIVSNSGNDRSPLGGTMGQSLPNWGKVATEGRGRTMVVTNLYVDADSLASRRQQARSILSVAAMQNYTDDPKPGLMSIVLHEAAHNLGPSHEYKYNKKTDDQAFGGPLATTLEELKAQTAALYLNQVMLQEGIIDATTSKQGLVSDFLWALGHISRGMYTATKQPKPYGQLAAIQLGFLMDKGAITFDPEALAANGTDKGAFELHHDKISAAVTELMQLVGRIKAKTDKAAAQQLIKQYVDNPKAPLPLITERMTKTPKASFVYAFDM
jgi:hypothetical protein